MNLKSNTLLMLLFSLLMIQICVVSHVWAESSDAEDALESGLTNMLIKSAEAGNANDQMELGFLYAIGDGVPKDHVLAYKWLSLAAEHGYASPFLDAVKGNISKQDLEKAKQLAAAWKKAHKK